MSKRRGKRAAQSGKYGENTAEALFEASGFSVVSYAKYRGGTPVAVRQYPVPHPFRPYKDRAGANDFMLFTGTKKVYCQVKNQDTNGTTDEKLAFAFDIASFALTDEPFDIFCLILLGRWWGQNPGILEWAKRKCVEFEMLAGRRRNEIHAVVLVGPKRLAAWLSEMELTTTDNPPPRKPSSGQKRLPFGDDA